MGIDMHSGLWILWLFAGCCLIVLLVGCASFDRFKAELIRLKKLASIDVDFNHTKDNEADDEVSEMEELHYSDDQKQKTNTIAKAKVRDLRSAKQNFGKLKTFMSRNMIFTVNAAKKEMNRIKVKIEQHYASQKQDELMEGVNELGIPAEHERECAVI